MTEWHTLDTQDAIHQIDSNLESSLTAAEAARRLEEYGLNELVERAGKSAWSILLEQFTEIMVVILIISAVISAIRGDMKWGVTARPSDCMSCWIVEE